LCIKLEIIKEHFNLVYVYEIMSQLTYEPME
jgi:hypothetical protein